MSPLKVVDGDDERHAHLRDVLRVPVEIAQAALDGRDILGVQALLAHAAVHLQGANRRHQRYRVRRQTGGGRDDVAVLLKAQIGTETRLRHHDVAEFYAQVALP